MSEDQTTEAPKKQKQTVPLAVFIVVTVIAFGFGYMYAGQQTPEPSPTVTVTVAPKAEATETQAPAQPSLKTSFGDGTFVVGQTFEPGNYTTQGPEVGGLCLYQWLTSTGKDGEIVNQSTTKGSATVTLAEGEIFESMRCGTWTKTG